MILAVIDLGKILYFENNLESKIDEVITAYKASKDEEKITKDLKLKEDKIEVTIKEEEEFVELSLTKETEIITPGLNLILKNPFQMIAKRVIYNE